MLFELVDFAEHRDLITLMASGLTDAAIGRRLNISERTVRRRVAEVMNDLGASTRFQAGLFIALSVSSGSPKS